MIADEIIDDIPDGAIRVKADYMSSLSVSHFQSSTYIAHNDGLAEQDTNSIVSMHVPWGAIAAAAVREQFERHARYGKPGGEPGCLAGPNVLLTPADPGNILGEGEIQVKYPFYAMDT